MIDGGGDRSLDMCFDTRRLFLDMAYEAVYSQLL